MTHTEPATATPLVVADGTRETFPLAVDLDGTLTPGNTLGEGWLVLMRRSPIRAILAIFWLARGRAYFKTRIAAAAPLVPSQLLWNEQVLAWLRSQREGGRGIILTTGAAESWALSVADHLDLFDEVLASRPGLNLTGRAKRKALDDRFGIDAWDYIGDCAADQAVWAGARISYTVDSATARTGRTTVQQLPGTQRRVRGFRIWARALRVHQWSKNLLIFAPALLAHHTGIVHSLVLSGVGFLAFSAIASATYLINDALDLPHDRAHPRKRTRPLATGAISLEQVAIVATVLATVAMALGIWLGATFTAVLLAYAALTLTYSFVLKQRAAADVMALAALYVLRLVAGSTASNVPLSAWFLAFAVFLFTSLGFAKRATEIAALGTKEDDPGGRGYYRTDLGVLVSLGSAAAYTAILVFALYINSPDVRRLYAKPDLLWIAAFAMMGWISRIWLKAQRGELGDDPVAYAISDRPSLALGAVCAAAVAVAALWR